ncbi:hypothetical protein F2Q70_00037769 [Brassica cretica]|uniref:Uncharacterized protein n=1 Tax=Brassica cretica TaxID=69181 RepID=A0A8S9JYD7_BRACR|nr:hypothetical protein F2Q68_00033232 [Brassica cretica]KAF2586557.1 hypothetical protein F2Q70_00037769 [Brassica cretica]
MVSTQTTGNPYHQDHRRLLSQQEKIPPQQRQSQATQEDGRSEKLNEAVKASSPLWC